MKKFVLHLFDLDDTLISTSSSYLNAYRTVLSSLSRASKQTALENLSFETLGAFCRFFGSGNPELVFTKICQFYDCKTSWHTKQLADAFWKEFWQNLQIFPGAREYLCLLSNMQKKIAIVSNGDIARQQKKLAIVGLQKQFSSDKCFVSANSKFTKPSCLMLEEAIKYNQVAKEQTIFYGNLDSDILAGRLAKITTASLIISPAIYQKLTFKADYHFTSWARAAKQLL